MSMRYEKRLLIKYLDELIAGGFAVAAAGFLFAGMTSRIFFRRVILWTEEAAMLCFVWSVFLGIASVYQREIHVGADMLIRMLPETGKRAVRALVCLLFALMNGYLFWLSLNYTLGVWDQSLPELGISRAWMAAAMPVSFARSSWHSFGRLFAGAAERTRRREG